jgi:hypothetical protein
MSPRTCKEVLKVSGGKAFSWSTLWFIGWLFTIGFAHLSFWKGVLALLIWPYYLGSLLK